MIYLDNAATTMKKPKAVIEAVCEAMESLGNSGRGIHDASLNASRVIFQTREKIAALLGAKRPEEIVFTMNSTQSLNYAIKGILQKKDHVITTVLEHNSVLRPLYEMEKEGVELTILPCDSLGNISYEEMEKQIKENTKAIICTHGSNLTGNLVDIKRVGEIAKRNHLLFVVDASQTAGFCEINVQDMKIDILCFTGHKSLYGPQGTGGMYINPEIKVKSLIVGGSGVQTFAKEHPAQMPEALEAGTLNAHGLAGLSAAIDFLWQEGMEKIKEKEKQLMWSFYEKIKEIPGICIYGDFTKKDRCPIVALNIGDYDSGQVSDALYQKFEIATRPGGHCAPLLHAAMGTVEQGMVRFSFSYFNTLEEVEKAVEAIRQLAA